MADTPPQRRGILAVFSLGRCDMNKATSSLRQQMTLIILLCWLLPMAIAATVVGWYLLSGAGRQKEQAMS